MRLLMYKVIKEKFILNVRQTKYGNIKLCVLKHDFENSNVSIDLGNVPNLIPPSELECRPRARLETPQAQILW